MRVGWGLAFLGVWMVPAAAQDFALQFPVDCSLGVTCVLQQFMDHDPGPGAKDFACGAATYDGHSGTDIRVGAAARRAGVEVRAPAAGRVVGVRDGMPDRRAMTDADRAAIEGRECGNGLAIDHGNGWRTQLCHMALGSLRVAPGDRVAAGQVVGLVGLSGDTQFPHLHLRVDKDGRLVDPFAPELQPGTCGTVQGGSLWADPVVAEMAQQPTRLLAVGFADRAPGFEAVLEGAFDGYVPLRGVPMVLWATAVNGQGGDRLVLRVDGPGGRVVARASDPLDRRKAQFFAFSGARARADGWAPGTYRWSVTLDRAGASLDRRSGKFTLR